jgi:phosphate transport system substrate-binding protein
MDIPRGGKTVKRTTPRLAWSAALLILSVSLVAAACGSDKTSTSSGSNDTTATTAAAGGSVSTDYSKLSGTLNGSGSTFQDAFEQKALTEFKDKASNVTVNYTKSGSTAGKTDLSHGVVQFAGTDSTIKPTDGLTFANGTPLYFPIVAAPITVSFNVSGVKSLKLDASTIAGIFSTKIATWDASEIKALNPGVKLPSSPIAVVHRSDGSGTTSNFTKYLTLAAPADWTLGSGDTVNWPASTQGAQKGSGVASLIASTPNSIGYVDLADAVTANLVYATVKNSAGSYIKADLAGSAAALDGITVNADLTYNPLNASGAKAYPITSPTWIIVSPKQPDAATAATLKGYIGFILTDGQKFANSVGFSPVSADLDKKAIAQLDQITS